jgi:hypothetical protein
MAVYLGPNVRLQPGFSCCHVEARRTIDAITVEQRHRWHL